MKFDADTIILDGVRDYDFMDRRGGVYELKRSVCIVTLVFASNAVHLLTSPHDLYADTVDLTGIAGIEGIDALWHALPEMRFSPVTYDQGGKAGCV